MKNFKHLMSLVFTCCMTMFITAPTLLASQEILEIDWSDAKVGTSGQIVSNTERLHGLKIMPVIQANRTAKIVNGPFDGIKAVHFKNTNTTSGNGSYLRIKDQDLLTGHENGTGLNALTIDVWIKVSEIKQSIIVAKMGNKNLYQLYISKSGHVGFRIQSPKKNANVLTKQKVVPGKWHHVVATWEDSIEPYNYNIIFDGYVTRATRMIGNLANTDGDLSIGGLIRTNGSTGQFFNGSISDIKVSIDRKDLLDTPGRVDDSAVKPSGKHLESQPGFVKGQFIYTDLPTPECHASSIVQMSDGNYLAAWFGGTCEGHIDVDIWTSIYDGKSWSKPRNTANGIQHRDKRYWSWNPILHQEPNGPLMLFYKVGPLETPWGMLTTSHDNSKTWSHPVRLPEDIRGAGKNKPIRLSDGKLIFSSEGGGLKFEITEDLGKTWRIARAEDPLNCTPIQPAILQHQDGRLQALVRARGDKIVQTWSNDSGETWEPLSYTNLPGNFSGIDAVTLQDGRHILVYNHAATPKGRWGGKRSPINVAVSDDGVNWNAAVVLEDEPGEFSYPAVIQDKDGMVHITYTWNRFTVKHVILDPSKFVTKQIVDGKWPK
ncbi:exo-alpha-sialidase [Poriferisphaera sp. WC338]|uniref:exo-alpha-sialidase n=1 Tax=Poriferisphaera sp. WC338 TaxID=3425129 RepID=UPI003D81753E